MSLTSPIENTRVRPSNLVLHCPVCLQEIKFPARAELALASAAECSACSARLPNPPHPDREGDSSIIARVTLPDANGIAPANRSPRAMFIDNFINEILNDGAPTDGRSVLDIGCADGAYLETAQAHGWKCFGVESSEPLRTQALARLGQGACVVASVEDLVPHEFDVILVRNIIEVLDSPYPFFYGLFSKGAIGPRTRVVVSTITPRAASAAIGATGDHAGDFAQLRVLYSEQSLHFVFNRLRFTSIETAPCAPCDPDETQDLVVTATGSDFSEFMQERYVPGTWSHIAEYEHMPRYALAKTMASGAMVMDFGCGTGYGSAILASVAAKVVGVDIDAGAIDWATQSHKPSNTATNLQFFRRDDLADSFEARSFDLVTCFEMIEHVNHATQQSVVASLGRVLKDDGLLLISTPNPAVTRLYGENPHHIREMTLSEFRELLSPVFPFVQVLEQRVRSSVSFAPTAGSVGSGGATLPDSGGSSDAAAFVAVCSRAAIADVPAATYFDNGHDFILDYLRREKLLNAARFESYHQGEAVMSLNAAVMSLNASVHALQDRVRTNEAVAEFLRSTLNEKRRLEEMMYAKDQSLADTRASLAGTQADLLALRQTKWFLLRDSLIRDAWSPRKVSRIAWLIVTLLTPRPLRRRVAAASAKLVRRIGSLRAAGPAPVDAVAPHAVHIKTPISPVRERVVHVIANFMTGGSSRLVVDLIEHLSEKFEQSVITSFIPNPPAYTGLDIQEFRRPDDEMIFVRHLKTVAPAFIHVHYWGDCDEPWYALVIRAAEYLNIPIIENLNTPVTPFSSPRLVRCVYVSDYVRTTFGREDPRNLTIYPGSDFGRFVRMSSESPPEDCVGMVYRLEKDKLNESAIEPFIRIVQMRPQTRALIVGGGSLLRGFQRAVLEAGVADRFEFTGYVSYERLPELYRRITVFVAPVWKESFGQVSAFAMNMRVPVIGYAVGAITEIVDDPTLVAPPANANRLAEVAVRLLDSSELRARVGEKQQSRAQDLFSLQAMCERYAALYADVLVEQRPPTE